MEDKYECLLVKPGEHPEKVTIGTELSDLQNAVGGYIEVLYPFAEQVGIICNEEGKIEGLPLNRALKDDHGDVYDVIAGDMLIIGLGEEDFASLTSEQMEKYEKEFHDPECFVKMGKGIIAVPITDDEMKTTEHSSEKATARNAAAPAI